MSEARTTIGDLVDYHIGGGWGSEARDENNTDGAYVIRGTDIPRVIRGDTSTVPFRFHPASNLASRRLRVDDIVFEVSGGSKGQPVGRALRVTRELLNSFNAPVMCASFCKLVRVNPELAEPGFIFRDLQVAYVDGRLGTYQVQSTGITNFKWKPFLAQFDVHLPERVEQRSVDVFLQVFDDLIENNRRRIELLESMARAIYREWFVHFRFPGYEEVPMVDSDLGPIPEGWRASTSGEELNFIGGGTPSKKVDEYWSDATIPWYTPSDLTKNRSRYASPPERCINELGVAKSSARIFPSGSVMMTSRATLGVLSIVTTEATTNQGFIVIQPDLRWSPGFIREWLASNEAELAAIGTGATFKEITKGAFKRFPFVVPAQAVLDAYRDRTDSLEGEIARLEETSRLLASMRDLLLPKLVTGEIDVSGLDVDGVIGEAVA